MRLNLFYSCSVSMMLAMGVTAINLVDHSADESYLDFNYAQATSELEKKIKPSAGGMKFTPYLSDREDVCNADSSDSDDDDILTTKHHRKGQSLGN